jgi:hypothetical protein
MKSSLALSVLGVSSLGLLCSLGSLSGCSSGGSDLRNGERNPQSGGSGSTAGIPANTGVGADSTGRGGTSGIGLSLVGGGTGIIEADAACGAKEQKAKLTPVNIVIMMDKSGSMGNGSKSSSPQNYESRWAPVKAGMIAFFEGAHTTGVSASLSYFPTDGDMATTCGNNYTSPNVTLTPLEDPTRLVASLNLTEPSGGTPTLSAVYGATSYAKKLMNDAPNSKSVVLLVTDGEPAIYVTEDETTGDLNEDGQILSYTDPNCVPTALKSTTMQNIVPDVAQVVSGAATNDPKVPTYVVGIGTSVESLSEIAVAGGTDMILIDNTTDPAATTATIVGVLEKIRKKEFPCVMDIPEATDKGDVDFGMVNVNFVHSDTTVEQLIRSDTCSSAGWHYDVAPSPGVVPTKIELCPQTCITVQADPDGQLKFILGCETIVIPPE